MHELRRDLDPPPPVPVSVPRGAGPGNDRLSAGPNTLHHLLGHLHPPLRALPPARPRRADQQRSRAMPDPDVGDRIHDAHVLRLPNRQQRILGTQLWPRLDVPRGRHVVDRNRMDVRDAAVLLRDACARTFAPQRPTPNINHHPSRGGRDARDRGCRRSELLLRDIRRAGRAHHHHIVLRRGCRPDPRPYPIHVLIPPAPRVRLAGGGADSHDLHPRRAHGPDSRGADPARLCLQKTLRRVQPGHVPDGRSRGADGDRVSAAGVADDGAGRDLADPLAVRDGRPRLASRTKVDAGVERDHLPHGHAGDVDATVRRADGLVLLSRHHRHLDAVPRHGVFHQLRFHHLEDRQG